MYSKKNYVHNITYPLNIEGKNHKLNDIILSESSNTEFATLEQKFVAYF